MGSSEETRRGRPVDNRPSTDYLHHFVQFCDKWHMIQEIWHVTGATWHMTRDTQGVVNIVSKFQVPSFNSLGVKMSCDMWHVFCLQLFVKINGSYNLLTQFEK